MRNFNVMLFALGLLGLAGCSGGPVDDSQAIVIETQPQGGAQCLLHNGRGSWTLATTPGVVSVQRSPSSLTVSCRTEDNWLGGASLTPSLALLQYPKTLPLMGGPDDSAYDYPDHLQIALLPVQPQTSRPPFGAEGGRSVPPPLDPLADRARLEDDNVAIRFQTLRLLLDQGLITSEEYNLRRGGNLGALLRYSVTPGGRDLGRPTPPPQQVLARLRYLAAAYAEHSISAAEQAAERSTILDGLLPAAPARRADPPPPIRSDLALAAEIGRIERLRLANVISDKEAAGEKAKVAELLNASVLASETAARAAAGVAVAGPAASASTIGVALSIHSSQAQARRIWAGLQKVYPEELGRLTLKLKAVPRPHRPSHWRITAGPLPDDNGATALCRTLKRRGVACEPTSLGE